MFNGSSRHHAGGTAVDHPVRPPVGPAVAALLSGRVVAVTGAGGSIGSELCRQVWEAGARELIMVDRDESALRSVQGSLDGHALLDTNDVVLVDVRDRLGVTRLFEQCRPEVVFHAAALNDLPLLERYPAEALKTNVWGTRAVLDAAATAGVTRFVNISTDRAADPRSVFGYSKRICEGLTAYKARETRRAYVSVRFGSALPSRDAVVSGFRNQIAAGGPVTVAHPDVARSFMTIEEIVGLVLEAGAVGRCGAVLVLDLGDPVRIGDLALGLAGSCDPPIAVEYTGLGPGEQLRETLLADGEAGVATGHPCITTVDVGPLDPALVSDIDPTQDDEALVDRLRACCDGIGQRTRPS